MGADTKSGTAGAAGSKKRRYLQDGFFIAHRLEMLLSPAWGLAPQPLRKIIERLEIEHLRHGGYENGDLYVTYSQFVAAGISKKTIRPAVTLGEQLGLIQCILDDNPKGDIRGANKYRLTFVPAKGRREPTDDWKKITVEKAKDFIEQFRRASDDEKVDANRSKKVA
ncbi:MULTISPECIES: hypothetical protein [unclassified Mesorhizobium]|uniref:hypothetical protein n=1 Tax=unclassified Mesorhizobium TaxID=325217 RepID=UPI0003CF2BBF|nr:MULTISPECIES: hypothetical protein [unclassified Mesorhizobium]ESY51587.1 hypothetical protein X745_22535 [Mesorhizobium sp. LNJC374B00]ESY58472.1 hypothetical protein X744_17045 [Mesorhizobium sp. LNJC372A00]WJI78975.1 hypothetical protein NLY34_19070 [Mesorhizobium sp. C374B]WJI85511.1 hypothetical protein NLY42_21470 [Mesorhizobium sp. C372A]